MPKTCLDETGAEIVRELYIAVSKVAPDDMSLLACIGSWGDTADDDQILEMLKQHNAS